MMFYQCSIIKMMAFFVNVFTDKSVLQCNLI